MHGSPFDLLEPTPTWDDLESLVSDAAVTDLVAIGEALDRTWARPPSTG